MVKPWPLISSEVAVDVGFFKVKRDRAQSPRTGQSRDFLIIHMPDWLQVVPVTKDGRVVLVNQYRHASRMAGLEIPGGLIDPEDKSPAEAAARELEEETGYGGGEMIDLGRFHPQPALIANRVSVFAARGVELTGQPTPDAGEDIEVVLAAPRELDEMMADGRIHNAATIMSILLAQRAGVF